MNARIEDLMYQSGLTAHGCWDKMDAYDQQAIEKLIKLIVQECIGVVEGGNFLHDQAPDAIWAKQCSAAVKRHFGVKDAQ